MGQQSGPRGFLSLTDRRPGLQWLALLALSAMAALLLEILRMPAALLLGPMAAAIAITAADGSIRVGRLPYLAAQGIVGCMMARSLSPAILGTLFQDWPLFLAAVVSVIAISAGLGWGLARWRVLPGTTAVWGSSPGAAMAMVLLADAHGADARLVAFMQYLRVVMVAVMASLVARIWVASPTVEPPALPWFPAVSWLPFGETLALAGVGIVAGRFLRIPAAPFLLPLVVGAVLNGSAVMTITLPPWLLALCYVLIGWSIGLRFTRPILVHALRALPKVTLSIALLIALCGVMAWMLTRFAGIDPLTAYLATSPGGADTVAIIAASSAVDQPFVMALQTARFLIVLITGPALARFLARRLMRTGRTP